MNSDYFTIDVDNHTSTCITNSVNHFIGLNRLMINRIVKRYVGMIKYIGREKPNGKLKTMIKIYTPSSSIEAITYQIPQSACFHHNRGTNRQMTTIRYLMVHSDIPRPRTAPATRTNTVTRAPPHVIQAPTLEKYVPLQVPMHTLFLSQKWNKILKNRIRNMGDLTQHQLSVMNVTDRKT